jgi:DNA polymerase-3 subunit alpha
MANLPGALHEAEQCARDASLGQSDLFGAGEAAASAEPPRVTVAEWSEEERLAGEKETLGLYLTGHPITRYERELRVLTTGCIADLVGASSMDGQPSGMGTRSEQMVTIAGFVLGLRALQTRRGRMAFVTLDDRTARVEVAVFSDLYQNARALLVKDRLVVVEGKLSPDEFSGGFRLSAERIHDIAHLRATRARGLAIALDMQQAGNGFVAALKTTLTPFRHGACPVWIDYRNTQASGRMVLGDDWRVQPTDELLQRLRDLAGCDAVEVCYSMEAGGQASGAGKAFA